MEEMITIPLSEYASLKRSEALLGALQAVGVDNWDGYDIAIEMIEEEE